MTISTLPAESSFTTCCYPPRAETREQFDAHGIIRHALAKGIVVLLCENGRGHEDRYLLSIHHGFERRANADLCLSESDITAY